MKITGQYAAGQVRRAQTDAGSGVRSLGNTGDIIEGIVRKVSDKVSIDFNGKEVNFSRKTVQDAREGSSIKFKIMDVSDDRIVLKALGDPDDAVNSKNAGKTATILQQTGQAVTGAGNQSSDYMYSKLSGESGNQNNSESEDRLSEDMSDENHSNIANITSEDIRSADAVCDSIFVELEEYNLEAFDRLVESIKDKRLMETAVIEGQQEKVRNIRETIEKTVIKNKLPNGISKALAEYFVKYDIPVTREKLDQIGLALHQARGIEDINEKTIKYLLQSEQQITISNLYNASYMSSTVSISVIDEQVYEELKPQLEGIVRTAGYEINSIYMERARWLVANDIPVNKENLDRQDMLIGLGKSGFDEESLLERIMTSVAESKDPSKESLIDTEADRLRQSVRDFKSIDISTVDTVVKEGGRLCLESLRQAAGSEGTGADGYVVKGRTTGQGSFRRTRSDSSDLIYGNSGEITSDGRRGAVSSETARSIGEIYSAGSQSSVSYTETTIDISIVTARRQLEEIRLSMTIQSARSLQTRGIDIDTTELSDIVEGLRQIERENIKDTLAIQGMYADDEEVDIISTTIEYRNTIAEAPSYTLAMTRQIDLSGEGNLTTYADVARNETVRMARAGAAYETMMTTPRSDMGDSLQKAFVNVDSLIEDAGLEVNEANQRIVRILAQNQMEISTDNITMMQDYDAKMQYMLKGLKPETAFELIREGYNPLTMSLEALNTVITEINEEMSRDRRDEGESSYSRFLWKLEKEERISEEERESYIGICRLVRHITKNDNASLGAVVKSGRELTLKNLMTAVRSRRDSGMDEKIDDSYAGRESRVISDIDEQISRAYDINHNTQTESRIYSALTPSALYEVSGGDIENIMNMPLDELADKLEEAQAEDSGTDSEYYDYLAKEMADSIRDEDAMNFIKAYDMEPSLFALNAARQIMSTGQTVLADIFGMSKYSDRRYSNESISEYEEAVEGLVDALEDEETMQAQCEKTAAAAKKLLDETENGIIRNDDLGTLRLMNSGIRFNRLMSDRRSYEIPIATENGITNINLTLVRSENAGSMINIRLDSEIYGNINIDYSIHGDRLQGLVLTENNVEAIDGLYEDVAEAAAECGYQVVSVNRGIHNVRGAYVPGANYRDAVSGDRRRSRDNDINEADAGVADRAAARADTANMYRLSKNIIHKISKRL